MFCSSLKHLEHQCLPKLWNRKKRDNCGEWIGQFYFFFKGKKKTVSWMKGRKCGFFSCCILSFIRNSLRFWQAAFITGVYLLYLKKDRLYGACWDNSAGDWAVNQHTTFLLHLFINNSHKTKQPHTTGDKKQLINNIIGLHTALSRFSFNLLY